MAGEVDYTAVYVAHHPDGDIRLVCLTMEGGHPTDQGGPSRDGTTGKVVQRHGLSDMENLTVEVEIDPFVWSQKKKLKQRGFRYTATKQMVDATRAPVGEPDVFTGWHGTADFGSFDINGGDNTSTLEIESRVDEP